MSTSSATKQHTLLKAGISLIVSLCLIGWTSLPAPIAQAQPAQSTTEQASVPTAADYANLEEGTYDPDTVIVKYREDATPATALNALKDTDGVDEAATKKDGQLTAEALDDNFATIQLDEGASVTDAIEALDAEGAVEYAQPNFIYHLLDEDSGETASADNSSLAAQSTTVNDPDTKKDERSWHLKRIGAYDAWDLAKTNHQVTVAVLDTGCDVSHPDLEDNILTEYAWDEYRDEQLTKDYDSHGTHVAGLIAATANNGIGTAGSSYNANIIPIQVFEPGGEGEEYNETYSTSTALLYDAYNYVLNLAKQHPDLNIHVVNMSLGGPIEGVNGANELGNTDRAFEEVIAEGRAAGIVAVCAGGNGKGDAAQSPDDSYTVPSDFDECFSVTALSKDGKTPTSWCSYNEYKDICAPGESIYSTVPHSSCEPKSGTSMAAPIVSGCFALLWAADPNLTVDEATEAITSTADTENFKPLREGCYGAGVIDIAAALEKVQTASNCSDNADDNTGKTDGNTDDNSGATVSPSKTSLSGASLSGITAKTYNGSGRTQSGLKVTLKGKALKSGTDYRVSYSSNKYVGTARVTITGMGNYTGSTSKTFAINPAATAVRKLKAKKRAATVTWKKRTAQTSGYQIRYSRSSSMKSAKTKTVKSAKAGSATLSKLKAKKTYYIQVRTYKKVGSKTYRSAWSSKKKVRTK